VRQIQSSFSNKGPELWAPHRKWKSSDNASVWTGSNDTDKKQDEITIHLFSDMILTTTPIKDGQCKYIKHVMIESLSLANPKLRKWMAKSKDIKIVVKDPNKVRTYSMRKGAFNNVRFSVRNTLEILNDSGSETIFKVCMESPLKLATFKSDFTKFKETWNKIQDQHDERLLQKAESAKKCNFRKSKT